MLRRKKPGRRQKLPQTLHTFKRPKEIEKLRRDIRKAHHIPDPDNLPPGFTGSTITIPLSPWVANDDNPAVAESPVQPKAPEQSLPQPETVSDDAAPGFGRENEAGSPEDVWYAPGDEFYYPLACGDKVLNIKPANLWMAQQSLQPVPKKLFGDFWLEGELSLMYADTNMGKSILAVQIGDSISRRQAIAPFEMETEAQATLYIDFELSAKQFELRYRLKETAHEFSPVFFRAEYNTQITVPDKYNSFDQYIYDTLEWGIRNTEPRVLIIDNITCLTEGNHHAATAAVNLMKNLKAMQVKHRLSILVLAHTHKRDAARPLTRNDMGGSKMLMNFADSAFAIGQSGTDTGLRYLKQMKQRSGSLLYGEDHVCLCRMVRHNGFLKYEFDGFAHEYNHLRRNSIANRDKVAADSQRLHGEGLSQRQIARSLNVSASTVNRMLEKQYQDNVNLHAAWRRDCAHATQQEAIMAAYLKDAEELDLE